MAKNWYGESWEESAGKPKPVKAELANKPAKKQDGTWVWQLIALALVLYFCWGGKEWFQKTRSDRKRKADIEARELDLREDVLESLGR